MIHLGELNHLTIARIVPPGAILVDDNGEEVLLPGKYIPSGAKVDDEIDVFIYKDSEDRPVATTEEPNVHVNEFAVLKVKDVNKMGAFLDWGLEKDLLVPFKEQNARMEIGRWYLIYLYLDDRSNRLVATAKINKFYQKDLSGLEPEQKVDLLIADNTELGTNVVVNNTFRGLIFKSDIFQDLMMGERTIGYVKKIRDDHKLDILLKPTGLSGLDEGAGIILEELKQANGFLPIHDKSDPEEIRMLLQMSKKAFKRSVGILYKKKLVTLTSSGIKLTGPGEV